MELQAFLQCVDICSPAPFRAARFYSETYGMALQARGDDFRCTATGREVRLSRGLANQLRFALFTLKSAAAWEAFLVRIRPLDRRPVPDALDLPDATVALEDPDGNRLLFAPPGNTKTAGADPQVLPAVLQHFALRTQKLPEMLDFYTTQLGFVLSDAVKTESGDLRACFLRTDELHHALALFFAPVSCFDHQSFEAPDWASMKHWGDRMAALKVPIVWGLGRHGPGNDVFFMVRDPDGNLAEISSEIEHCAPDRQAGLWPHEERTLNLWGKAILRS